MTTIEISTPLCVTTFCAGYAWARVQAYRRSGFSERCRENAQACEIAVYRCVLVSLATWVTWSLWRMA